MYCSTGKTSFLVMADGFARLELPESEDDEHNFCGTPVDWRIKSSF